MRKEGSGTSSIDIASIPHRVIMSRSVFEKGRQAVVERAVDRVYDAENDARWELRHLRHLRHLSNSSQWVDS